MTRTENDLRTALRELERRADEHGAPSTEGLLDATTEDRLTGHSALGARRFPQWLPPLAAAAVVAATAITAVTLGTQHSGSSHRTHVQAGGRPTSGHSATHRNAPLSQHPSSTAILAASAGAVLQQAAGKLDAAPAWTSPPGQDFFYVRTTQATTWTSVSGRKAGEGRTAGGGTIWVPGCVHGQIVSGGESGSCTLNDVPHYLRDAPTAPAAWDAYLERMAPGSKAADAQGKFIVQVLHQDLVAPEAAAALLRYTVGCPGLHTLAVRPVDGEKLIGVTCTSMTNGSYGLVFDAGSQGLVGFVVVTSSGHQDGPAEIIRQSGIVPATGRTP